MNFNKTKHIERMQPSVNKLLTYLKTKGIEFIHQDESGLENCVFKKATKVVKMSHHSFYRYSGISVFTKDKGDGTNQSIVTPVTDDMYMNLFMKPIIETLIEN